MTTAHIDGRQIWYQQAGSGPPLLLLLPQSNGPVGVQPFVDALAERYTVIRYDQRGTGRSDPAPGALSMDLLGAEAGDLLNEINIDSAHLVCHSTGCGLGLSLAASRPGLVSGLALANPWSYADPHLTRMQNLRVACARGLGAKDYATFNAALLFPPEYRRAHEAGFADLVDRAVKQPPNPDVIAERLAAILAFDARTVAPSIQAPTVVVTAQDDQLMPPWLALELTTLMPQAHGLTLSGGGHMLPETSPEELSLAVLNHLSAVDLSNRG